MLAQRPTRWPLAAGITLVFVGLLVYQGLDVARSEGRRTGVEIDQGAAAIAITSVLPGLAADRAGVREGDEVLWLDGMRTVKVGDWDLAAADFSPSRPVDLTVRRDGQELALTLTPGAPVPWLQVGTNAIAVLGYLGLVLLVLLQEKRDLRTRLLLLFSLSVAIELVLPIGSIGSYDLLIWALSAYYLLTGLEIGIELHLAALIPERPDWLRRQRWVIPGFYVFGLSFGGLAAATFLLEDIAGLDPFPWTSGQIEEALLHLALPLWALGVAVLLAVPAFSHPQPRQRQQAALVLMGVLPWVLWMLVSTTLDRAGILGNLYRMQTLESLVLLCYPVAVFVAIFRYHLFDIEVAVRRSLLYGTLPSALILLLYAALGAGGAVFSQIAENSGLVWMVAGATLVLGLLFAPMIGTLERSIDRRLFPERHALRAQLVALAS